MAFKLVENDAQFNELLKQAGDKPVFVDFMAEWCGNCEKIFDNLEELAKKYGEEKALYLQVNVEECEETQTAHEVTSLPTVLCFKNGVKAGAMFGNKDEKYTQFFADMLA